jgi:hypothetical protein
MKERRKKANWNKKKINITETESNNREQRRTYAKFVICNMTRN